MYDYLEAIMDDVKDWISENDEDVKAHYDAYDGDIDGLYEWLEEELWTCDSVTGNGSGSYTFNKEDAKEYVISDDGISNLKAMTDEGYIEYDTIGEKVVNEDWEYLDVSIRCCKVSEAIRRVLDDLADDGFFDYYDDGEDEDEDEDF